MTGVWAPKTEDAPRKLIRAPVPGWADVALTVAPETRPCSNWSRDCTGASSKSSAVSTSTEVPRARRVVSAPTPVTTISFREMAVDDISMSAVAVCPAASETDRSVSS